MNIGTSIRKLRVKKDINQKNLSKTIGITQSYLSQIEKGHKKPSTNVLERVSKALDLPILLLVWFGVEESDIHETKREVFKTLKPSIDALMNGLI